MLKWRPFLIKRKRGNNMKIRQMLVNSNKYNIKCPYGMTPKFIVVHNTANDASANNEISYMINNNNEVSFHIAVDDKEAVQGIPFNRNAWHAGDGGNGNGNRNGIAIEICYSKSGGDRFVKAEQNAAKLVAQLLKERGWGIDKVKKHQDFSNKYCPHRTLDMGWQRFLNMIKAELDALNGVKPNKPNKPTTPPKKEKYYKGMPFTCTGLWTQAKGGTWYSKSQLAYGKGTYTIGNIHSGSEHPYEALYNGTIIGFANDKCIDDEPSTPNGVATSKPTQPNTTKKEKYGVGTPVCTNTLATQSTGGKVYKGDWKGTITKVVHGAKYPYLLNNGTGWTNDAGIDSDPHTPKI